MKTNDPIPGRIATSGVLAVLVIDRVEDAVPVAEALLAGGVDAMELTLRTEAALPSLAAISAEVPEMMVGIGTIIDPLQVKQVVDAGGSFGVSPGTNPEVIRAAEQAGRLHLAAEAAGKGKAVAPRSCEDCRRLD